jgi:Helicase conserved C-terminal domain
MRRTKGTLGENILMMEKTVTIHRVRFPEGQHKEIHDCLYMAAKIAFDASINGRGRDYTESEEGVTQVAQQAMFSLLLRVRQSCASGELVNKGQFERARQVVNSLKDDNGEAKKLTAKEGNKMIDILQSTDPTNDRRLLVGGNSPKISALLKLIEVMGREEKAVIFSQWTSFLDIIGRALAGAGHQHVRIDGSMTTEQRTNAMNKLSRDDGVRFILCSLKAAGVGINLTRANVVFMMVRPETTFSLREVLLDLCDNARSLLCISHTAVPRTLGGMMLLRQALRSIAKWLHFAWLTLALCISFPFLKLSDASNR